MRKAARSSSKLTTPTAASTKLTPQQRGGKKRSADAAKKLLDMLEVVRLEISSNAGAYPYGRLSMRAVAKRAGVHQSTLHTKNGKAAGDVVHKFVKAHNAPKDGETHRPSRKRTVAERLHDKTVEYETLLQQHQVRNLHLQQARSERDDARALVAELQSTVAKLEAELASMAGVAKQAKSPEVPAKRTSSTKSAQLTKSTQARVLPFRKGSDGKSEP
jgi:hypothetical protein